MAKKPVKPGRAAHKQVAANAPSSPAQAEDLSVQQPRPHAAPGSMRVSVIGIGRLGRQLAWWLAQAGHEVCTLSANGNRAPDHKRIRVSPTLTQSIEDSDIIFLTIPEQGISLLLKQLPPTKLSLSNKLLAHCSGAHPASVLKPLTKMGADIACFHPLQSFGPIVAIGGPSPFAGITIGIEASEGATENLSLLARSLGSTPVRISSDATARANYHAAAVMASNALVPLMDSAIAMMVRAGVEPVAARDALLPLVRGTLANLEQHTPAQALTGPVVRGEVETIRAHLAALGDDPELKGMYVHMTGSIVGLAVTSGRLDVPTAQKIVETMMGDFDGD